MSDIVECYIECWPQTWFLKLIAVQVCTPVSLNITQFSLNIAPNSLFTVSSQWWNLLVTLFIKKCIIFNSLPFTPNLQSAWQHDSVKMSAPFILPSVLIYLRYAVRSLRFTLTVCISYLCAKNSKSLILWPCDVLNVFRNSSNFSNESSKT